MRAIGVCLVAVGALWIAAAALGSGADRITIGVSSDPTVGATYDITLRGASHKPARAWLFIEYTRCAKSFAAERKHAPPQSSVRYPVNGSFAKTSGWQSNSTVVDHACAYLVAKGAGKLLARARVSFTIHSQSHP
jgi:hypothetical protein